jgi:hypothetical protein
MDQKELRHLEYFEKQGSSLNAEKREFVRKELEKWVDMP